MTDDKWTLLQRRQCNFWNHVVRKVELNLVQANEDTCSLTLVPLMVLEKRRECLSFLPFLGKNQCSLVRSIMAPREKRYLSANSLTLLLYPSSRSLASSRGNLLMKGLERTLLNSKRLPPSLHPSLPYDRATCFAHRTKRMLKTINFCFSFIRWLNICT